MLEVLDLKEFLLCVSFLILVQNKMNEIIKKAPSNLLRLPSKQKNIKKVADNKKNAKVSNLIFLTAIGHIITANGNTNVMFAILEPIMFPIAILDSLIILALMLTTNSGKLVPKEIKVNPIIYLGIPREDASSFPYLIIRSAPKYIKSALEKN